MIQTSRMETMNGGEHYHEGHEATKDGAYASVVTCFVTFVNSW